MVINFSLFTDVSIFKEDFSSLRLNEDEVGCLYGSFESIIRNIQVTLKIQPPPPKKGVPPTGDLNVSIANLRTALKISRDGNNKFAMKLFSVHDHNFTGKMNFRAFVMVVWNICTVDTGTVC